MRGPFWRLILLKEKTQTCRKPRVRFIRVGDVLSLYWKQRQPEGSKPIHLIAYAKCEATERRPYSSFAFDDEFARRDGFTDSAELREWFGDPAEYGGDPYDVISFTTHFSPITNIGEFLAVYDAMDDFRRKGLNFIMSTSGRGFGMSFSMEYKAAEYFGKMINLNFRPKTRLFPRLR